MQHAQSASGVKLRGDEEVLRHTIAFFSFGAAWMVASSAARSIPSWAEILAMYLTSCSLQPLFSLVGSQRAASTYRQRRDHSFRILMVQPLGAPELSAPCRPRFQ